MKKPYPFRTARLLSNLGRWLSPECVLMVVVLFVGGCYFLTACRLCTPGVLSRMSFYAQLLNLPNPDDPKNDFTSLYEKLLKTSSSEDGFKFQPVQGDLVHDGAKFLPLLEQTVRAVAHEKDGHGLRLALLRLHPLLEHWSETVPRPTTLQNRFTEDSYRRHGVDFAQPRGDLKDLKTKAKSFLQFGHLFAGDWNEFVSAPLPDLFMPWNLVEFYDETRAKLNNTLPWLIGTILLATGLLLRFRLVDCDLAGRVDREGFYVKASSRWEPIWQESVYKERVQCSLASYKALPWLVIFSVGLLLYVEFFLNEPIQRVEWLVNAPVMWLIGLTAAPLCFTLWEMGHLELNERIGRYSAEWRERQLQPLLLATWALILDVFWVLLYSVFVLPRSSPQALRAVIQGMLCVLVVLLLIRVLWNIHRQTARIEALQLPAVDKEDERTKNVLQKSFLQLLVPNLDARIVQSASVALIPLPIVIGLFFKG